MENEKSDFDIVVKKFQSKITKSYDFLIRSDEKYKDTIFKLCRKMMIEGDFPIMFGNTLLYMIWKSKGPQEVLRNNMFIHLKEHYLPRSVESLVVNKMKDDILSKSTMYQVGGQPGHSTDEPVFTIKSLIDFLEVRGQGMIFTLMDLISFLYPEE